MSEVTQIPQKAVVVSATKPTAPFEGLLWRDTSNDVLKQYNGNKFVSVQTSPDGVTIQQNSNGNLVVAKPSNELVGIFENGQDGWSESQSTATSSVTLSTNQAFEGSQSLRLQNGSTASQEVTQDFNVDGVSKFVTYIYADLVASNIRLYVDGNKEVEILSATNSWNRYEVDLSSYSGTVTFEYQTYDDNDSYIDKNYFVTERGEVVASNVD